MKTKQLLFLFIVFILFLSCEKDNEMTGIHEMVYYDCGEPVQVIPSGEYTQTITLVDKSGIVKDIFLGIKKVTVSVNGQETIIHNTFMDGLEIHMYKKELKGDFFLLKQEGSKLHVSIEANHTEVERTIEIDIATMGYPIDNLMIIQSKN